VFESGTYMIYLCLLIFADYIIEMIYLQPSDNIDIDNGLPALVVVYFWQ
jgi:hypothetical protein